MEKNIEKKIGNEEVYDLGGVIYEVGDKLPCPYTSDVDCSGADLHGKCMTDYGHCEIFRVKDSVRSR
jgi:hypothetical protein